METKTKSISTLRNKKDFTLLRKTKYIFSCLRKQLSYILPCGNKAKDSLLLRKTKIIFCCDMS